MRKLSLPVLAAVLLLGATAANAAGLAGYNNQAIYGLTDQQKQQLLDNVKTLDDVMKDAGISDQKLVDGLRKEYSTLNQRLVDVIKANSALSNLDISVNPSTGRVEATNLAGQVMGFSVGLPTTATTVNPFTGQLDNMGLLVLEKADGTASYALPDLTTVKQELSTVQEAVNAALPTGQTLTVSGTTSAGTVSLSATSGEGNSPTLTANGAAVTDQQAQQAANSYLSGSPTDLHGSYTVQVGTNAPATVTIDANTPIPQTAMPANPFVME